MSFSARPTRKAGEKGKRSPTNDSPEAKRDRKKINRTTVLPILFEASESESSANSGSDSDVTENEGLFAHRIATVKSTSPAKKPSVILTMSDINNFSALLRNAFLDPETAIAMRSVFKPLLDEQTNDIKKEINEIRQDINEVKIKHSNLEKRTGSLEGEVTQLQEENRTLKQTLEQQQRYLETVDFDRRQHNLILMGLNENEDLTLGSTDEEKVKHILSDIGHPNVAVLKVQRLGEHHSDNQRRPRPLKVALHPTTDRRKILESTHKLKTAGPILSKVYIKKDIHPGIRREIKRLRDTEKREREKPDNQGRTVSYDWKARCVKVDDIIVDTYRPAFF